MRYLLLCFILTLALPVGAQTATRTPIVLTNAVTPTRTPTMTRTPTRTPSQMPTRTPSRTPTRTTTPAPPAPTLRPTTTAAASQTAFPTWTPGGPTKTPVVWDTLTPFPDGVFRPIAPPPFPGGDGSSNINIGGDTVLVLALWISEITVQFWFTIKLVAGGLINLLDAVLIFGVILYGIRKIQPRIERGR